MEKSFFVLGGAGLVLCSLAIFYIFGDISMSDTSTSANIRYIQNFSFEGQFVSMVFWTVLSLLGGSLWVSALFRTRSVMGTSIISLVLGALVISLSVALVSSNTFFQTDKLYSGLLTEFTLLSLVLFVFIGFLSRILREIIFSGTSSLGIGKK